MQKAGTLWGQLAPRRCGPGVCQVLCACHLGATAGAVVSTEQGCPDVRCAEVTLVGWGELGQAGGLGPTEAAGALVPGTLLPSCYPGGGGM